MDKKTIIEKKAMLDLMEQLFDKLEYYEQDAKRDIESWQEAMENMTEDEKKVCWQAREIETLRVRLDVIAAVSKHLEKLI